MNGPTLHLVHVSGPSHKVHHALRCDDIPGASSNTRPTCGAERWGTYRNEPSDRPLTCARCIARAVNAYCSQCGAA
jgi:hypothetical protein